MRRILAAIAVLAISTSASPACAGWQTSAAARMACCSSSHDGCGDQLAADACCAQSEDGRQQHLTPAFIVAVPVASVAVLPATILHDPRRTSAAAFERTMYRYPTSPPVLGTILLI